MKNIVIFDLDGTLALIGHRKHFVECDKKDQNWDAFYEACDKDIQNLPIAVINRMFGNSLGWVIFILSGRSEAVLGKTHDWLRFHGIRYEQLRMRPEGDYTPDDVLKKQWAEEIGIDRIAMVFDDRDKVVKMWRSLGLTCLQVAEGNF